MSSIEPLKIIDVWDNKNKKSAKDILKSIFGFLISLTIALMFIVFQEDVKERAALSYLFLFLACLGSHTSVLVPSSSTLIVIGASLVLNPLLCGLFGGVGAAIGDHTSYFCGRCGKVFVDQSKVYRWLLPKIEKNGFLWVFIFSFVPLPIYDFAGLASGICGMKLWKYTAASFLGIVPKTVFYAYCGFWLLNTAVGYFDILPGDLARIIAEYIRDIISNL